MFRIRFHGRGGQGMKTASRILGSAFFLEGYETQDAPRYGAERRGAPMFAYVRAAKTTIFERGIILRPDLVVVADESLLLLQSAGVLADLAEHSLLLISSSHSPEELQKKLGMVRPLLTLSMPVPKDIFTSHPPQSSACAAAAAQLLGLSLQSVRQALHMELSGLSDEKMAENEETANSAFLQMEPHRGRVGEQPETGSVSEDRPSWIILPFEDARISSPAIHGEATSLLMDTGSWRSLKPFIHKEQCSRCDLCHTYCPEGAISFDNDGYPCIDYKHCKGCLICLVQCPLHAIEAVQEDGSFHNNKQGDDQCDNS